MKKLLYMAVAAIAALSSCQGDDVNDNFNVNPNLNPNGNVNPNVNAPVFTATIEGEGETRTQLADGSATGKKKVNWESGDEVKMVFAYQEGEESDPVYTFPVYQATPSTEDASTATLKIKDGETYNSAANIFLAASYPASIVTDDMKVVFPATQQYQGDGKIGFAPMYVMNPSPSIPQSLTFFNACALLEITIPYTQMTSVRSITVSSDLQMNGVVKPCTNGAFFFETPSNPGDGKNQVTLDCYSLNNANVAITEGGSKTFYVSIASRGDANTYPYLKYLQIDVTDGNITKTMRTKTFEGTKESGIEIKRNKIYPIAFAKNYDPNLLAGEFSVSATKKVQFTKGNLWCNASVSPTTFGFETNQYDFPTSYSYPDDATTKLWTCTHVGHFFWSSYADYTLTEATASPGNPHEFKPYFSAYGPKSKSASDEFWCSEDHKLEVAGTQGLYTLSADEWSYLLNPPYLESSTGRTQTNRFARARVNDTYGYLIFPDGYNGETAVSGTGIGTVNEDGDSGYPSENIPPATWADMEAAGVVFLPNAGIRKGTEYTSGYGKYWSSTPDGISNAKNVYFDANGIVYCPGNTYRSDGSSIRLVKTVGATPAPTSTTSTESLGNGGNIFSSDN